jgi:hypothetical protein
VPAAVEDGWVPEYDEPPGILPVPPVPESLLVGALEPKKQIEEEKRLAEEEAEK